MILRVFRLLAAVSVLLGAFPALAQEEAKDLRIVRITPEGENVTGARQIVIQYNRPVVPLGDMARTADTLGITISPPVNCEWRWLNTSALSCNLGEGEALKPATRYSVRVEPKITAEDGATIAESIDHDFTTQTASVENSFIRTWLSPETPQFFINFNQPVTQDSARAHLFFENEKDKTRTAVKISPREDDDTKPVEAHGKSGRYNWILEPAAPLPANASILLKEESGLVSVDGDEPGKVTVEGGRTLKHFYTYPPLSVRGVICRDKNGHEVTITPGTPQTDAQLCNPLAPVSLSLSAPVLRSALKDALIFSPDLTGGKKNVDPWGEVNDWSRLSDSRSRQDADYRVPLPYGLKAAQEYTISIPEKKLSLWARIVAFFKGGKPAAATKLVDEFGRALPPFQLTFATGHRNPNYELPYNDAVLEKNTDSDVPLYVNNLKDYSFDYITASGKNTSTGPVALAQIEDVQFGVPAGVRDMLDGKSGALFGKLKTTPDVADKWEQAGRLFAQVTPYQVYAKIGHFNSTIWVSDLATGKPVPDAAIEIYPGRFTELGQRGKVSASVKTNADGIATTAGLSELDPDLSLNRSWRDDDYRLFIRVDKDGDMALLPLSYNYEVSLWNVATDIYNNTNEQYGHMKAWGMTAQGIYRAGDTMQYKIFVRDQDNNGFVPPPAGKYALTITDPAGKEVEKRDHVTLSAFGTFDGEYKIPQNAPVGWYQFRLSATLKRKNADDAQRDFYPLSVLVSDFTPAPFRVTTELNGDAFKAGDKLEITSDAKLHSGGAFGDAAIRSTVTLRSRPFTTKNPAAKGFTFDSFKDETDREDIFQKDDKLDDKGEWSTSLSLPEKDIVYGQLIVEGSVRDDRGKSIASEARADYAGVDRLVGLKPAQWVFTAKEPATVQALVVDPKGAPVSGVAIHMVMEKEDVVTAKVKGAGNAYLNDNTVEWREVGKCDLVSSAEGKDCAITPDSAGTYRITATIKDTKDRVHTTQQTLWVSGTDYVQWNEGRENALPILPEKPEYKVGETARYLVKNPYPGAYALVTIERFGVIDHFVRKLDSSTPVIDIPVKPDYAPGFYLSVVAMSGRVDAPLPKLGQIDLGKPTFRVGYAKTPVVDPYKSMTVTAKTAQDVYRPRDTVKVSLEAKPLHAEEKKEPVELAVAVLDESVFDLIADGKNAFDPYHGFYDLENLDVLNYSLMTRLMGRQKFEKKGANPGGDGGIDASMRNLFKYVSYWNPSVPVDKNGRAAIEFEAPDNLTGWRVLALAVTPTDRMGLGEATFKVNRPTELRPVMPNQVREGDAFKAGFSVMNRTDAPRTIKVAIKASGDLKEGSETVKEESIILEPYKRAAVYIPLEAAALPVTHDVPQGEIAFTATASDDVDADGVEHNLPVLKSRSTEVAANYGSTTEDTARESIAVPQNIFADSSDLSITLSPTILGNLDGAFEYMRDYPYPCWEQKLSKALMASSYQKLKPYLDVTWTEAADLPQSVLDMAGAYQAPNGGMAYYIGKDDYVDPYLSAYTALAFGWLEKSGYKIPVQVRENLNKYLLSFLRNNSAPDYYQDGMTSSVRAVILAALTNDGITKDDVLRFRPELKNMSLFGKSHFAQAALAFPETKDAANEALNMILSSGAESGGKYSLNETYSDGFRRILSTPLRDNCVAMDAILLFDNEGVKDVPSKLVRYITQARGNRNHFENTQENIFCLNALAGYAAKYESAKPDMTVSASYRDTPMGKAAFTGLKDAPVTLTKPLENKDAGQKGTLSIERNGDGRLYYATRLRYAPRDLKDAVNAGIDIRREYSLKKDGKWVLAHTPFVVKRGDLVKVDLFVSLPTARNFVVVNDPLPGGLETVNTDLATASKVDADQAAFDESGGSYWFKFNDWKEFNLSRWSFYHKELRHDSARFYADWLDVGNYHLSYMAQAVADGVFAIPPVKAEEMYDPDIFGIGVKEELRVEETP